MSNNLRTPCEEIPVGKKPSPKRASKYEKWILLATILGSSLAFIDSTIVNVALAALQDALHASINQLQWATCCRLSTR